MITKINKAEVKLGEAFNNMPGRETIENILLHYLGQNGISKYEAVNLPEKNFWTNEEDTLVIAIDNEEVWRFGADASMQFAINLACFKDECKADEFHAVRKGSKTIMRFWWD